MSDQKPMLVAKFDSVDIDSKVTVNGRPWLVIESDIGTNAAIGYYTLKPTTINKDTSLMPDYPDVPVDPTIINVHPLDAIALTTEGGYNIPSIELNNLRVTATSVNFVVPVDASEFTVKIKSNQVIITKSYKVVL